MSLRAFRLFISSTFSDFAAERVILHESVFPSVERYCLERGYQFHPIDLRWGVSEEAQIDQKTVGICLNAVKTSKLFPPPNFLLMLGNRYGWVPLPYAIECHEYEAIQSFLEIQGDVTSAVKLAEHYRHDLNYLIDRQLIKANETGAQSTAYVLKEQTPYGEFANSAKWQNLEASLRQALQKAADYLLAQGKLRPDESYEKYYRSLTEQEIRLGLGGNITPKPTPEISGKRSFAFLREITGNTTQTTSVFVENNPRLDTLKETIKTTLPQSNIYTAVAMIRQDAEAPSLDSGYLNTFATKLEDFLKTNIDAHIKQVNETERTPDYKLIEERAQHEIFRDGMLKVFFGRDKYLQTIEKFLDGQSNYPLIIHGGSGVGKSAFMARAMKTAQVSQTVPVIARFVGASAASSERQTMLISLIEDLAAHGLVRSQQKFETNDNKFNDQISGLLSAIDQPVVIFIDALDQLQKPDTLNWLPDKLPVTLRMVLSVLDDVDYPSDSTYFQMMSCKYAKQDYLKLGAFGVDHAANTLKALHEQVRSSLQPEQMCYTLRKFQAAKSSPLYLKIAFEISQNWHSWDLTGDGANQKSLAKDLPTLVVQFFSELTTEHHHDKKLLSRALGMLAAARYGLSEKELTDILSSDPDVMQSVSNDYYEDTLGKLPPSVWTRLEMQLAVFLVKKQIDNQPLMHFFHRQVTQVVEAIYYEAEKLQLHKKLAVYFENLNQPERNRTRYNLRALSELPFQLYSSGNIKKLHQILLDPAYMEDELTANGVLSLIRNYRNFGDKAGQTVQLTGQTIELIAEPLGHNPRQLLPQLLSRIMPNMDVGMGEMLDKAHDLLKLPALISRWPTLTQAGGPEIRRFEGHTFQISGVDFSPDGRTIASCSLDWTLRLWDIESGSSRTFEGHTNLVNAIAFSPDGRSIVSGSWDNTLRLWDVETGHSRALEGHADAVSAVAFSPDGQTIVSGSDDMTLRLWDVETGHSRILEGHKDAICAVTFSPDGRTIISGSQDKTIRLWDAETTQFDILKGHTDRVLTVAISPDGRTIASGSRDKTLQLWDSKTGHSHVLKGNTQWVTAIAFSPDGRTIVSGSNDRKLRFWDLETGLSRTLAAHTDWVTAVAFSPDGQTIGSGGGDNTLRLWNADIDHTHAHKAHDNWVTALAFNLNGQSLVSGSRDKTLRLWDVKSGRSHVLGDHLHWLVALAFSPDGRTIVSGSVDKTLRLWDVETGHSRVLEERKGSVTAVSFSPNGQSIAFICGDNILRVWNMETCNTRMLNGHTDKVTAFAYSADGQTIVSSSRDKTLRLWNVGDGQSSVVASDTHTATVIGFSADGRTIVSDSAAKMLRLWNVETGRSRVLEGHTDKVTAIVFNPDGRTLISSSWDMTLRLWDVETGSQLARFDCDSFLSALALNGHTLAVGDHGGSVHLFEILLDNLDKQAWIRGK